MTGHASASDTLDLVEVGRKMEKRWRFDGGYVNLLWNCGPQNSPCCDLPKFRQITYLISLSPRSHASATMSLAPWTRPPPPTTAGSALALWRPPSRDLVHCYVHRPPTAKLFKVLTLLLGTRAALPSRSMNSSRMASRWCSSVSCCCSRRCIRRSTSTTALLIWMKALRHFQKTSNQRQSRVFCKFLHVLCAVLALVQNLPYQGRACAWALSLRQLVLFTR